MDHRIIGGVFSKVGHAEKAISDLLHHGYGSDDISVFAKDKNKVNVLEEEMDTSVKSNKANRGSSAGKGAGLGAISGGALGGIGGLITGLGLLAIPGIGQIAAAGPIAASLTGAGVGAGGGGIVGALVGAGMPKKDAQQYEDHLKNGKIIVIVEATEKMQDKVYRTFLSNHTENKSMYPHHYQNHDHTTHDNSVEHHEYDERTNTVEDETHSTHSHTNNLHHEEETHSTHPHTNDLHHEEETHSTHPHTNDPHHEEETRSRTAKRHHSSKH